MSAIFCAMHHNLQQILLLPSRFCNSQILRCGSHLLSWSSALKCAFVKKSHSTIFILVTYINPHITWCQDKVRNSYHCKETKSQEDTKEHARKCLQLSIHHMSMHIRSKLNKTVHAALQKTRHCIKKKNTKWKVVRKHRKATLELKHAKETHMWNSVQMCRCLAHNAVWRVIKGRQKTGLPVRGRNIRKSWAKNKIILLTDWDTVHFYKQRSIVKNSSSL